MMPATSTLHLSSAATTGLRDSLSLLVEECLCPELRIDRLELADAILAHGVEDALLSVDDSLRIGNALRGQDVGLVADRLIDACEAHAEAVLDTLGIQSGLLSHSRQECILAVEIVLKPICFSEGEILDVLCVFETTDLCLTTALIDRSLRFAARRFDNPLGIAATCRLLRETSSQGLLEIVLGVAERLPGRAPIGLDRGANCGNLPLCVAATLLRSGGGGLDGLEYRGLTVSTSERICGLGVADRLELRFEYSSSSRFPFLAEETTSENPEQDDPLEVVILLIVVHHRHQRCGVHPFPVLHHRHDGVGVDTFLDHDGFVAFVHVLFPPMVGHPQKSCTGFKSDYRWAHEALSKYNNIK